MREITMSNMRFNLSKGRLQNLLTDGGPIAVTTGRGSNKVRVAVLMKYEEYRNYEILEKGTDPNHRAGDAEPPSEQS